MSKTRYEYGNSCGCDIADQSLIPGDDISQRISNQILVKAPHILHNRLRMIQTYILIPHDLPHENPAQGSIVCPVPCGRERQSFVFEPSRYRQHKLGFRMWTKIAKTWVYKKNQCQHQKKNFI